MYSVSASRDDVSALIPMEDIDILNPGETTERVLQVHFEHHLLPLKLVLWCDGRKQLVKLRPDIGYFIKPLVMDIEAFLKKESQLPGMFENIRRSVSFKQLIVYRLCIHMLVLVETFKHRVLSTVCGLLLILDVNIFLCIYAKQFKLFQKVTRMKCSINILSLAFYQTILLWDINSLLVLQFCA